MSSMRNAAPRRPHRERSQPGARSKWGLLEKHKDYSLRAADYNKKKQKLSILSQKSREKNPDEFAFGMLSGGSQKAGKHGRGDGDKNRLSVDEVKLLKGQDAGYLRTVLSRTRREVTKVQEEIGLDGVMKRRSLGDDGKVLFDQHGEPIRKKRRLSAESEDELEDDLSDGDLDMDAEVEAGIESTDVQQVDDTLAVQAMTMAQDDSSDQERTSKVKSKKQLQSESNAAARLKLQKRHRKRIREARAAKLDALKARQKSIMAAAQELELQRAKMGRTIGGLNKNGVKFKVRERKR